MSGYVNFTDFIILSVDVSDVNISDVSTLSIGVNNVSINYVNALYVDVNNVSRQVSAPVSSVASVPAAVGAQWV